MVYRRGAHSIETAALIVWGAYCAQCPQQVLVKAPRRMSAKETTSRAPARLGRPPRGSEGDATLRILAAAKPIFLSKGYEAASIDAIAGSAGISKKTIYARFATKEDLFEG